MLILDRCESLGDIWDRIKYKVSLWSLSQGSFKGLFLSDVAGIGVLLCSYILCKIVGILIPNLSKQ